MTDQTKELISKWIDDNRMGPPIHGAIYDPSEHPFQGVGIDGEVDLGGLAESIEAAERERCAQIAEELADNGEETGPLIVAGIRGGQ